LQIGNFLKSFTIFKNTGAESPRGSVVNVSEDTMVRMLTLIDLRLKRLWRTAPPNLHTALAEMTVEFEDLMDGVGQEPLDELYALGENLARRLRDLPNLPSTGRPF